MLMIILVSSTMLFAQGQAESVDSFPSKPVTAVIGWSAGGGADIVFRALAEVFPKYANGQPLIVQNKGAAAGVPAITEFKKAAPTGYEVLHWNVAHLIKTHMNKVPFTATEFVPVLQVVASYNYLVVRADAPWNTLADFIADAKANPETIPVGNAGAGGGTHMIALAFEKTAGVSFNHVPYQGGGPALVGAMGGHVDSVICSPPEGVAQLQSGDLRCIAVFSENRLEDFPDVPTAKEQGVDFTLGQWRGLAAPKGTDPARIKIIHDAFKATMEDPDFIVLAKQAGILLDYKGTEEFTKWVEEQDQFYKELIIANKLGDKYKY